MVNNSKWNTVESRRPFKMESRRLCRVLRLPRAGVHAICKTLRLCASLLHCHDRYAAHRPYSSSRNTRHSTTTPGSNQASTYSSSNDLSWLTSLIATLPLRGFHTPLLTIFPSTLAAVLSKRITLAPCPALGRPRWRPESVDVLPIRDSMSLPLRSKPWFERTRGSGPLLFAPPERGTQHQHRCVERPVNNKTCCSRLSSCLDSKSTLESRRAWF